MSISSAASLVPRASAAASSTPPLRHPAARRNARTLQRRIYDPCCGSGDMCVQSEKFVQEHGGRIGDIAIYGQKSNYTT